MTPRRRNEGFTAAAVPLSARLGAWATETAKVLVPLEIRSRTETVDGRIRVLRGDDVTVTRFTATAHAGVRTEKLAAGVGAHHIKVAVPLKGLVTVTQAGRTAALRPGEMAVYSTSTPYRVGSEGAFDLVVALVPEQMVGVTEARVLDAAACPIDPVTARGVRASLLAGQDGDAAELVADRVRTLISRVRTRDCAFRDAGTLYAEALDIIERRVGSSQLGPEYVAAALGVSLRTLYGAFPEHPRSVAATIRSVRVNHARDMLSRAAFDHLSIAEVGAAAGFPNSAHFSRLFRAEFGVAPSAVRCAMRPPS